MVLITLKQLARKTNANEVMTIITSQFHEKLNGRKLANCIEDLHAMSSKSFEAMITDETRHKIRKDKA